MHLEKLTCISVSQKIFHASKIQKLMGKIQAHKLYKASILFIIGRKNVREFSDLNGKYDESTNIGGNISLSKVILETLKIA